MSSRATSYSVLDARFKRVRALEAIGGAGGGGSPGPQGPQGNQGAPGVQGAQGGAGAQGAAGAAGAQGPQGNAGSQGPQGGSGTQGSQGAPGPQGSTGTQGPPGATGPQGNQGTQGNQGVQGSQGTQGAQGSQGSVGPLPSFATVAAGGTLGASSNTTILADITGATASNVDMPAAPANNDEITVVFTNWNFGTGLGPTATPGPAANAGCNVVANAGQQLASPNVGVYSTVAGTITVVQYGTITWKYRAANQTWYIVASSIFS